MKSIEGYKLGKIITDGRTQQIYDLPDYPGLYLVLSKDRITAGNDGKAYNFKGKAEIANTTNCLVFKILNEAGIKTAYVKSCSSASFLAKSCEIIPIKWIIRRVAAGSFLRRNPSVEKGFRFSPPMLECFFKSDINHNFQLSDAQIISSKFKFNGLSIGQDELDIMKRTAVLVFEIMEKAWTTKNCALIDMKIEYGIDADGHIVLTDIINSDSWRLWSLPNWDPIVDKQVYRNFSSATDHELDLIKRNFIWVSKQLHEIIPRKDHLVVIIMGSATDSPHSEKIAASCRRLGLNTELRISSTHKSLEGTLQIVREYEGVISNLIFITVAGRSNGLGLILSGKTTYPVINCPPSKIDTMSMDIWSSLNTPPGLGVPTVLYPEAVAVHAAQILSLNNYMIYAKLRVKQLRNFITLKKADRAVRRVRFV